MTTPVRFYSSTAQTTNLTGSITNADTTITVGSTSGFPASLPYTLALDYGAANEELVDVTAVGGLSLTVTRAVDFTSASAHNAGAVVRHVSSARDFREAKDHELATNNVHGLTPADGDFVGTTKTQTLTNKTLVRATGSLERVDLYNTGTWVTSIIGDSANPNQSRFQILDNEVSLTKMAEFNSVGGMVLYNPPSVADNVYRLRVTNLAGSLDRAAIFSGGTLALTPSATTTFTYIDIKSPDTNTTKRTMKVTSDGTNAERFTLWNDGHVNITGQVGSATLLDIKHSQASPTGNYIRALDSGNNMLWAIGGDSKMVSYRRGDIRNDGSDGVVFRVFANTVSQTQDLQQWINQSNVVAAKVGSDGTGTFFRLLVGATFDSNAVSFNSGTVTAGSGWTISASNTILRGGWLMYGATLDRTGADIPVDGQGNIVGDPTVLTMPASRLPSSLFSGRLLGFHISNGIGFGDVQLNAATGVLVFSSWSTNNTSISGASGPYRVTMMYPID